MSAFFQEYQPAQEKHQAGIELATKVHDYEAAHDAYREGLERLDEAPPVALTAAEFAVQRARIVRDDAFVYARQAIAEGATAAQPDRLALAASGTIRTLNMTKLLIESNMFDDEATRGYAQLRSEHNATVSHLGRIGAIGQVLAIPPYNIRLRRPETYFSDANTWYLYGNFYYLASNAINAARYERLCGNLGLMFGWLRTAGGAAADAVIHDRENARRAFESVAIRLPALRSQNAASQSILARP